MDLDHIKKISAIYANQKDNKIKDGMMIPNETYIDFTSKVTDNHARRDCYL